MITAPKIHTDLLWDLSFLFIGLAVVYFIFVFFYRNRLSKRSWQVKERKMELSPMVSEFLFYEEESSKDEKSNYVKLKIEIRQLLKDDFNRKVLSEVLLDLRKDVSGDTQKRLFKLYQDLGLHNGDFGKLRSWRWQIVSKGILNLTQMQVDEAYSFITKFINDKRATIRKQAEIAVVTLKSEGINHFLDTTKYKISEWQQLKLLDVLRNNKDYQPPRFKAWLTSTNRHVVLFALRLIKFYNQNDADAALIELVKHKNSQIKEEAIGCIKEFNVIAALPTLKLVFWKSSTDVKISILDAIGALGQEEDIEFLELIENKEANFSVRSKAHSSINAISPDSIMPSKGLVNTANYKIPEDIAIVEEEEIEIENQIEIEQYSKDNLEEEIFKETIAPAIGEVKPNAVVENHDMSKSKIDENTSDKRQPEANEILSIDFLPVVVEEIVVAEDDEVDTSISLINEILVDYEEVPFENETETLQKKRTAIDISEEEIAFLPIVIDSIDVSDENDVTVQSYPASSTEEQSDAIVEINGIEIEFEEVQHIVPNQELESSIHYSQYQKSEILELMVIYEEITSATTEKQENNIQDQIDTYFLSLTSEDPQEDTMDEQSNGNPKSLQSYEAMKPQDEQKFKKILKDLISFQEQGKSEEKANDLKNWSLLEFGKEFVSKEEDSKITSEIQDALENDATDQVEKTYYDKPIIPKAILSEDIFDDIVLYKDDTEESRMQLLDDLTEMGDHREIPLLKELAVNERFKTVKDRIENLIEKFSEHEAKPEPEAFLKPFNVFEDLFRTCDTEAKLILMDEIVSVGDESEIDFLEGLLEVQEKEISNKAARILEELKAKLSAIKEAESSKTASAHIGNEVIIDKEEAIEDKTQIAYDSLMEELQIAPSQTSEIFDLTFELTDPKSITEKSEVKENGRVAKSTNQESFLNQICAFSNKFIDKLNG